MWNDSNKTTFRPCPTFFSWESVRFIRTCCCPEQGMGALDVKEEEDLKTWLFLLLPYFKRAWGWCPPCCPSRKSRWDGSQCGPAAVSALSCPHVACMACWSAACTPSFFSYFLLSRYKYPWWKKTNPFPSAVSCKLNGLQSFLSLVVWLVLGRGGDLGDRGRRWKPSGCLVPGAELPSSTGMGWTHLSDCGTTLLLSALLRKVMAVSSR